MPPRLRQALKRMKRLYDGAGGDGKAAQRRVVPPLVAAFPVHFVDQRLAGDEARDVSRQNVERE